MKVKAKMTSVKGKMKVKQFMLHGAPQSGKSSVRDLLADKPPVEKDSTRLVEDPVQAVCTNPSTTKFMKTGTSLLEKSNKGKSLLEVLDEVKVIRLLQREVQKKERKSKFIKEKEQGGVQNAIAKKTSKSLPTATKTKSKVVVQGNIMQNVAFTDAEKPTVNPSDVPQSSQSSLDELSPFSEVLQDIATNLDSIDPNIPTFFSCEYLNIVDSGGQPEFSNLLPLVCKSKSQHHAVVIRLDKKLHDRSPNCICINGKVYKFPQHLILTDYQLIERVLQLVAGSKSHVVIIGTFLDQQNKEESLQDKYDLLKPLMEKYESNLVLTDDEDEEPSKPIFAVNAIAPLGEDRTSYSQTLQKVLLSAPVLIHGAQVADKEGGIDVPLLWIAFELELNRQSKLRGVITMKEVNDVAKLLKVQNSSDALKFFNELGVLYHYPKALPDIVFTSISPISSRLSDIVEASFMLKLTPKTGNHKNFQKTGKLSSKFLKTLCSKAKSNDLFTDNEFISLLKYFRILFQIDEDTYLVPSILPIDPVHRQCIDYLQYREPLVCFWKYNDDHNNDLRILPQSFYHALIVELLSNKEKCTFALTQVCQSRLFFYFDASFQIHSGFEKRRVVLIDRTFWLEMLVHCCTPREQCLQLRDILQLCTTRVLELLDLTDLGKLECGRLCYLNHSDECRADCPNPHPAECTVPGQCVFECVTTKDILPKETSRRLFWFKGLCIKIHSIVDLRVGVLYHAS